MKLELTRKQHQHATAIPKVDNLSYSESHQNAITTRHGALGRQSSLDPMKTDSTQSLETGNNPGMSPPHNNSHQSDYKSKNKKNLSINIPEKNKYAEAQMHATKTSNEFVPVQSNPNNYHTNTNSNLKAQSQLIRMPSPSQFKGLSPVLMKSASKQMPSAFTQRGYGAGQYLSNMFNFNDFNFGSAGNYDSVLKTPELPSYLETPNTHLMNQFNHSGNLANNQLNGNAMMNQFQSQMNSRPAMNQHFGYHPQQNGQMNPPSNVGMANSNTPVTNHNYYKLNGYFEPTDSPYTKLGFNNRLIYPFPYGTAGEDGFSPFLKSANMALDVNNGGSSRIRTDKNPYFNFKNDNSVKDNNANSSAIYNTDDQGISDGIKKIDYTQESTSFGEKPKKKLKVQ